MAHITGGGLLDNLPRVLPDNLSALVDLPSSGWELPPVFKWLQTLANLPQVRAYCIMQGTWCMVYALVSACGYAHMDEFTRVYGSIVGCMSEGSEEKQMRSVRCTQRSPWHDMWWLWWSVRHLLQRLDSICVNEMRASISYKRRGNTMRFLLSHTVEWFLSIASPILLDQTTPSL